MQASIDVSKYQRMINDSTPGRFEGEPPITAYLYEAYLDGDCGVYEDDTVIVYELEPHERVTFNVSSTLYALAVSSDGFIRSWPITPTELDILFEQQWKDIFGDDE
jgi:hypothetical protein